MPLKMSPTKLLCAFVLSRLDYCSSRLECCPKYLLSKLQTLQNNATRLIFQNNQIRLRHILYFILFTDYLMITGSTASNRHTTVCFALRLFLIRLISVQNHLHLYTPFRQRSALLQTPVCSEYHPSEQNQLVSALSSTRLMLSLEPTPCICP